MKARPNQLSLVSNRSLVKTALVIDSRGTKSEPVQTLVPATHLLDLDALNRQLDGDFRALEGSEIKAFLKGPIEEVPALPNWSGMRCIVHKSLTAQSTVLLDAGANQDLIELDQSSFKNLVGACEIMDIAQPAPSIKPDTKFDEQDIINSVKKFTERRIRQRLDETLELPPLPRTAAQVIELRASDDPHIDKLVAIVESDPSLAAQVVSWAASPYYRAPSKIKSVQDAIVRVLGFDMVLNLTLGLSLGRSLKLKHIGHRELGDYWHQAMLLAKTCESLTMGIPSSIRPERGSVYLSGLLANLGYLILGEIFPLYFQQIKRQSLANRHLPSHVLERYVLGIDNNQVAAWLLENWQMPSEFVNAVRFANQWSYSGESNQHCKLILCSRHLLAKAELAPNFGPNLAGDMLDLLRIDDGFAEQKLDQIVSASEELDYRVKL